MKVDMKLKPCRTCTLKIDKLPIQKFSKLPNIKENSETGKYYQQHY